MRPKPEAPAKDRQAIPLISLLRAVVQSLKLNLGPFAHRDADQRNNDVCPGAGKQRGYVMRAELSFRRYPSEFLGRGHRVREGGEVRALPVDGGLENQPCRDQHPLLQPNGREQQRTLGMSDPRSASCLLNEFVPFGYELLI